MKFQNIGRSLAFTLLALPSALLAIDTDNDGLDDSVETNTGVYVSPSNTGTNPNLADSDSDGAGDWYEVAIIDKNPALGSPPNTPNDPNLKPNIPYPLPAPNSTPPASNKPVKVFIMSGQSNMVGQGNISPLGTAGTLETITKTEHKFPNLLNGASWSVRNDVTYRGVIAAIGNAPLTAGQGASATAIGPELGFGHVMGYFHDEPVLILKSSEGGRALGSDFLPPGSAQYAYGSNTYPAFGESPVSWATGTNPVPTTFYAGYQYDQSFLDDADMVAPSWANSTTYPQYAQVRSNGQVYVCKTNPNHISNLTSEPGVGAQWNTYWNKVFNVVDVLDNFATEYPQWASQGFEIAGFAWFQGWNDGLSYTAAYANNYEKNLAQFIRQLRSYYAARYPGKIKSKAPFVIATCAFDAWSTTYPTRVAVDNAQLAVSNPVKYPEFAGNVKTMEARNFWRDLSVSPANQNYHYHRNAETFMLVGDALGRGMIDLLNTTSGPDTLPPAITGSNPADNATGVATGVNLVLTFNESIALGTGNITLKNLTDSTQATIAITDGTQVSINGSFLTINPTADLAAGKSYAIQIAATAIKDLANNPFAGIADDTTWNFTTAVPDTTAPAISSLSPADNATGVVIATNLVMTFNESIAIGTGNVTIKNLTNSTQSVIPITDAAQVSISGSVLTINPTANLAASKGYAIRMDSGAVKDLSKKPFAGISDDTTWNFTTAAPPVNAEISIVGNPVEGFLNSAKNGFATAHLGTTQISYNATGATKLIVAIGTEAGNNNQKVNSVNVSFNGAAMIPASQDNTMSPAPGQTGAWDGGYAGIFYVDNPYQGPASFTFSASTTSGAPNGAHVTIIGLTGSKLGAGQTAASWATQTATGNVSTSITTTAGNSLVMAMVENSGRNNGSGTATLTSGSSMTPVHDGNWGSQWGTAASAYQKLPTIGTTITPTFTTNAGGNIHVVAAEFLAAEITTSYATWAAGPFQGTLSDTNASHDFDNGGLQTGIEWVVGGDPTKANDDASLAPIFDNTTDPNFFIFTYRRSDAANADTNTTIIAQYGVTPDSWTTASHDGTNIIVTESNDSYATGIDKVVVKIKKTLASGGKLFARLKVAVPQP